MTTTEQTPYIFLWLRSLAFWIVFPVSLVIFSCLLLLTVFFSFRTRWQLVQLWVHFILWWLKVTCKLTHEVQGTEHIGDLALMKCIHIKRGTGKAAVKQLVTQGKARLDEGIWVVIFPEGTRIPAGQRGRYRIGGAVLAEHSGYPIIPVAHNAGEYWPRRSFIKRPGVIQVRIGAPIQPRGRSAQQVLEEASGWIEERMSEITTLQ
jgi:1-acyl-sn-glycerol-3-phosphate acyltransferase